MTSPNLVVATERRLDYTHGNVIPSVTTVYGPTGSGALVEIADNQLLYVRNFWISNVHASQAGHVTLRIIDALATITEHCKSETVSVGTKRKNLLSGTVMHVPYGTSILVLSDADETSILQFRSDYEFLTDQ